MTPERFEDVEKRTKLVEEAIIEFKFIAKTVVVEHANKITALESDVDNLKSSIYLTCDAKTKEIDDKVHNAADEIRVQYDKYFMWCVAISSAIFFMMVGYVAYDQGQKADIGNALEARAVASQEAKTHIEVIHGALDKIDNKLDRIFENQAIIIDGGDNK